MMITIKDYVEGLFKDIPESAEKESIKQEIILNLEEKVQDLTESGKAEEDAVNKAIVDFGDIEEIKKDLMKASGGVKEPPRRKTNHVNNLWFSIWSSALIIGLVVFINYYYFAPYHLVCVSDVCCSVVAARDVFHMAQ